MKRLSSLVCLLLFISILSCFCISNAESSASSIFIRGYDANDLHESILKVILSSDKQLNLQEISFIIANQKLKATSKQKIIPVNQHYILIIDESRPYYLNRDGHSKAVIELAKQFIYATGLTGQYKLIWAGSKIETSEYINADEALTQIDERIQILSRNYHDGNGIVSINNAFREALNSITDTKNAYSIFVVSDFADTIYDMTFDLSAKGIPVYSLALINSASDKQSSNSERNQAISGRELIKEIALKTHGEYSEWDIYRAQRGEEYRSATIGGISQKLQSVIANTEEYHITIPTDSIPLIKSSNNKELTVEFAELPVSSFVMSEADYSLLPMTNTNNRQTEPAKTVQPFVFGAEMSEEDEETAITTPAIQKTNEEALTTLNTGHFTVSVPTTWIHVRDDSNGFDYYYAEKVKSINGGYLGIIQYNSLLQYSSLSGDAAYSLLDSVAEGMLGKNKGTVEHTSFNEIPAVTVRYAASETEYYNIAIAYNKGYVLVVGYLDENYDSDKTWTIAQGYFSTINLVNTTASVTNEPKSDLNNSIDNNGNSEMVTVKEYGFVPVKGFYYYSVILHNNMSDKAIQYPEIRITARDHSGNLISADSQTMNIIYPGQDIVWAGLGGSVDEVPESISIEFVEPSDDWHVVKTSRLKHESYLPLEIKSARIKQDKWFPAVIGEIYNPNSYDLSMVAITVVFRDDNGNLLAGDTGYINSLKAGKTTTFEINVSKELITESFEVYGQPW